MREDWIECEADLLGDLIRGINYKKPQSSDSQQKGYLPILRANNIKGNTLNFDDLKYVEQDLVKSEQKILRGDIVFAMSSGSKHLVGKSGQAKSDYKGSFGAFCSVFRPNKSVDPNFIQFYFHSGAFRRIISNASKGSNINNLKREHVLNAIIPLPSTSEQRAIVAKIEELFSGLDKGVADLKKAQDQLKVYRQAVLKKAFEGELTKEWRERKTNLSNWKFDVLKNIATLNPKPQKDKIPNELELQFLPMRLVEEVKNVIHLDETRKFEELQKKSYTFFEEGDVLFAKVTPCMENGKIAIAKNLKNKMGYGSSEFHVFRVGEKLLNEYLFHFLVQEKFRANSKHAMTGAVGLKRVPKKFLEDYEIPLPPLDEQHQIVQEIESRLSVCDKVEESITESLEKSLGLRQSILKKAFEGNLLSTKEIEKCKTASDYEPAEVLLKKIKLEKK